MGKPIAAIGHKVYCPKCRGNYPIVEGVMTSTVYGKGVAVEGMKTSCGATLIATQFTDCIDAPSGPASSASAGSSGSANSSSAAMSQSSAPQSPSANANAAAAANTFDEQFQLRGADGKPLPDKAYRIVTAGGKEFHGVTDADGKTQRVKTAAAEQVHIYLKS